MMKKTLTFRQLKRLVYERLDREISREYRLDRYELCLGMNTKQWWVYDNDYDCFIDPPAEVIDQLDGLEYDEQEDLLEKIVAKNPDWLFDEEYRYYDEDFEI